MTQIFDNTPNAKLADALRKQLESCNRADFCVGYFSLHGWQLLEARLKLPESSRLLVGMQLSKKLVEQLTDDSDNKQQSVKDFEQDFKDTVNRISPSNRWEATLQQLRQQLKDKKWTVKAFLDYPLHAKLYLLFGRDSSVASIGFVGSSNLSQSGLRDNGELNIDIDDATLLQQLKTWFNKHWENGHDITSNWENIIRSSWVTPVSPYHIYLKLAYDLAHGSNPDAFELPKIFKGELFNYQEFAIRIAKNYLDRHGGVMIADAVGLGKTIMAATIIKIIQEQEEDHSRRILIVCPPSLKAMWDSYIKGYDLRADAISHGQLKKDSNEFPPHSRPCPLIVIDESHNFCNHKTDRYTVLKDYIRRHSSKVLLLSATPYNTKFMDVANQLRLFVDENQDIGNLPVNSLSTDNHQSVNDAQPRTFKAFLASKTEDEQAWQNLFHRYLIRRTRNFIKENYIELADKKGRKFLESKKDDNRYYFPERIPKLVEFDLSISESNQYARLYSEHIVELLDTLFFPRSDIGSYIQEPNNSSGELKTDQEKAIKKLQQNKNAGSALKGIYRTNLFKRLESSGSTFLQSIANHIVRDYIFLFSLNENRKIPLRRRDISNIKKRVNIIDSADDFIDEEDITDEEDFIDREDLFNLKKSKFFKWRQSRDWKSELQQKARENLYNSQMDQDDAVDIPATHLMSTFKNRLEADIDKLLKILTDFPWHPEHDTKLNELRRLIISKKHKRDKVLIFSQFTDTVNYLKKYLDVDSLESTSTDKKQLSNLVKHFSPHSNPHMWQNGDKARPIRVLLATDVLSEGHNLQDCHVVVNYDLPWGIIRLIQRAGRVDRIGQQKPQIFCYSFMPAEGVEKVIGLRKRVRKRLNEYGSILGTDEQFGFEDQQLMHLSKNIPGTLDEDESDVSKNIDIASRADKVWRKAVEGKPGLKKKIKNLPRNAYSARFHTPNPDKPAGVLVLMQQNSINELMYINSQGQRLAKTALEIFNLAQCEPDTKRVERHEDHFLFIENIRKNAPSTFTADANSISYKILERLDKKPNINKNTNLKSALDMIKKYPLQAKAEEQLKNWNKFNDNRLSNMIIGLQSKNHLCQTNEQNAITMPKEVICSLGLNNDVI